MTAFRAPAGDPFDLALARFAPATRELIDSRELLHRIDTKFITTASVVAGVIPQLAGAYASMRVPTGSVARYRSLYFETPDLRCFHDHRRGRRIRHKVRVRHYPDRQLSYLEVKTKKNELVTIKQRSKLAFGVEDLGDGERAFLRDRVGDLAGELAPLVRVDFSRISLIGLDTEERVTIDLGIEISGLGGQRFRLGDVAIVEVKQSPFCVRTPVMRALHAASLRPRSLSKYIAAVAAIAPDERRNRLLPDLRDIVIGAS
jgi:hypothetical protein